MKLHDRHPTELADALRRLCQIEDEVEDGACDDCGSEHTTIYRSGYGAWFCFDCLVDNVVEEAQ